MEKLHLTLTKLLESPGYELGIGLPMTCAILKAAVRSCRACPLPNCPFLTPFIGPNPENPPSRVSRGLRGFFDF